MACEDLVKPLLDEFLHNCDHAEAHQCIKDKFAPDTMQHFVETSINHVLEKKNKDREEVRKCVQIFFSFHI